MKNKMWGGRFSEAPDAIMEEINASIDFDKALAPHDIAGSRAHAADAGRSRHHFGQGCEANRRGSGQDRVRDRRAARFTFSRALEDIHMNVEARLKETDRRAGRPAAHRALAQRPGGDRSSASGCATRSTRSTRGSHALQSALAAKAEATCRRRDAGLHASAERAAGHLRPSPPRLCRDAGARPRPLRRLPRGG